MVLLSWLPVGVLAALLIVFGRTLLPGRKPLVSVFAELARGELEPRVARYTRRVTQAWTLLFALLLIEAIGLAVYAPAAVGLLGNLFNSALVASLFVGEYLFRRRYLADLHHPSFLEYTRFLRRTRWRALHGR